MAQTEHDVFLLYNFERPKKTARMASNTGLKNPARDFRQLDDSLWQWTLKVNSYIMLAPFVHYHGSLNYIDCIQEYLRIHPDTYKHVYQHYYRAHIF